MIKWFANRFTFYSLWPSWTVEICVLKLPPNDLWFLPPSWPLCIVRMCSFKNPAQDIFHKIYICYLFYLLPCHYCHSPCCVKSMVEFLVIFFGPIENLSSTYQKLKLYQNCRLGSGNHNIPAENALFKSCNCYFFIRARRVFDKI